MKLSYDLPNYVDPKEIDDTHERFKYMFPFYRMSIETMEYKLNKLHDSKRALTKNTDLVHIEEVKKIFKTTPAWNE